jgi:lipoyl(octanoyl) transferase
VADPRYSVTSLADLGRPTTRPEVEIALRQAFEQVFGAVKTRLPEAIT